MFKKGVSAGEKASAQNVSDRFTQRTSLKSFRVRVCLQAGRGQSGFALYIHTELWGTGKLWLCKTPLIIGPNGHCMCM